MRLSCLPAISLCAILIGCDQASVMKKFTPQEDESAARGYVELLRQGKFEEIERELDPSLGDSNVLGTLRKMAEFFPADTPESVKVVGAHIFHGPELSRSEITLEYQFPNKWILVNVATQRKEGVSTVVGLNVTPIADSLENLNKFTLVGKSAIQYLTLACAIAALLFTFYVFILCIRSKGFKLKWLWMIVVLVGVGKFAVNWGTGQWSYQLIAFKIPCFSMTPLYGPWTVAGYIPLGASVYLNHLWKIRITGESAPPSGPTSRLLPPD